MATKVKLDWSGLGKKMEESQQGRKATQEDKRFYLQKFSEDGTAQSIIRFLPAMDADIPITMVCSHKFNGPGGFYGQNCPTTIGGQCPVCDANRAIWSTNENLARTRARKKKWIGNIVVIRDPGCPENEGKVFLFKFPKTVYDKIFAKIQPPKGAIDDPVIVFDPDEGANFKLIAEQKKLKIGNKEILYPDYKDSSFADVSKLENWEKIKDQCFGISEFTAEDQFKSYEELSNRFDIVSGQQTARPAANSGSNNSRPAHSSVEDEAPFDTSDVVEELPIEEDDSDFLSKLRKKSKG